MARTALSPAEVDEVWRRWRSGQAVKVLSREMRRHPSTVRELLKRTGRIRPVPRRRWELRLSLAERAARPKPTKLGEHQRTAPPIPTPARLHARLLPGRPRQHRRRTQRPTSTDPGVQDTIRGTGRGVALT